MATITTPTKNGTEFLIKGGVGDQKNVELAALKDGGYVATWQVDNGIVGQRYNADGTKTGMEFMVSKAESDQENHKISALDNGGFIVAWASSKVFPAGKILIQQFDDKANKKGVIIEVQGMDIPNHYETEAVDILSLKNSDFIVTWRSSAALKGKVYNSQNEALGETFTLMKNLREHDSNTVLLGNGNVAINGSGNLQLFDNKGKVIDSSFQMNTYNSIPSGTKLSSLKDGGFISVWSMTNQDGSWSGIFAQRFDENGNTVGTEFQVNTFTKDKQESPSVTQLTDGGFLITWHSWQQEEDKKGNGNTKYGVFGQRFNADNQPVGDEFQINTTTEDYQDTPSVITLNDGSIVVAWQSNKQNGSSDYDIYAQRFETGTIETTSTDTKPTTPNNDTTPASTSFEGTSKADSLQGNDSSNTILGLAGNDTLNGGAGDDIIKGGVGNDVLIGAVGADVLLGGAGADTFKLNSLEELGNTEETADIIVDFNKKQKDKIDLSGVDANEDKSGDQAFKLVKKFSDSDATGQLVFDAKTQMLSGSINADSDPEFVIQLNGVTVLVAADFVL